MKDTFAGKLEDDDDQLTPEEKKADYEKRKDIDHEDFIAKGNIYRVLAVRRAHTFSTLTSMNFLILIFCSFCVLA